MRPSVLTFCSLSLQEEGEASGTVQRPGESCPAGIPGGTQAPQKGSSVLNPRPQGCSAAQAVAEPGLRMNCRNQGLVPRGTGFWEFQMGSPFRDVLWPWRWGCASVLCIGQRGNGAFCPEWLVQQSGWSSICSSCSCHVAFSAWLLSRCVRFAVTDIE